MVAYNPIPYFADHWPIIPLAWLILGRKSKSYQYRKQTVLVETCSALGIQPRHDTTLGYYVNPGEAYRLLMSMRADKFRLAPDRVSMMLWLCGLPPVNAGEIPPYDIVMQREAMRVARLKEPQRTERAIRLLLRYRDGKQIRDALVSAVENEPKWFEEMLEGIAGIHVMREDIIRDQKVRGGEGVPMAEYRKQRKKRGQRVRET